jgi:hypothetical protein
MLTRHCLLRFPDKGILQGNFHPRNTVQDVFSWLWHSLNDAARSTGFELFTSPPKRLFSPESVETLAELGLIPAAIINLNWIGADTSQLWPYFSDDLMLRSDDKSVSVSSSSSSVLGGGSAFPTGRLLVPDGLSSADSSDGKVGSTVHSKTSSGSSNSGNTSSSKVAKVPKWLKNS